MIVLYSEDVEDDLDAIAAYIAIDSPRRAMAMIREIYAAIERISEGPLLYQLRPDVGSGRSSGHSGPLCDPLSR